MTRREWALTTAVALVAGGSGYAYNAWRTAAEAEARQAVAALEAAELPNLDGKAQALRQWRGKLVVLNFWATWCAPCREEIPVFIRLQDRYGDRGLQFVGIAIDHPSKVRPYAAELGMNFPILVGWMEAIELARKLGNRSGVLPFTLVLARDGTIAMTHIGALKEAQLEPLLTSML